MPDDIEEPIQLTKEPVFDVEDIETSLDPETAYCLANLIDAAKAHGLYPFNYDKPALKVMAVVRDDRGAILDFRDSLNEQPAVQALHRRRLERAKP
jgi:hypothetical protein